MENLDITPLIQQFQEHLNIPENHRIIFSGKFGSGKTYFLRNFFEEKDTNYIKIRLAPVNYVVATNEDIFELIKFDILLELICLNSQYKLFEQSEIDSLVKLPFFIGKNALDIAKIIVEKSIPVGKDVVEVADKLLSLFTEFKEFGKIDEFKDVKDFLESFKVHNGSIYEADQFTNVICNCIEKLKKDKKEVVLVIDDLDRIDPEHIFRLFNIFSAHIDIERETKTQLHNKFGFDKIIFVCDIDNIRNIYHARYGANVDFSGYIDKFYSKQIFKYDINNVLEDFIYSFYNSLEIVYKASSNDTLIQIENKNEVVFLLKCFVIANQLNVRVFENKFGLKIPIGVSNIKLKNENGDAFYNHDLQLVEICSVLIRILGSINKLMESLKKCSEDNSMSVLLKQFELKYNNSLLAAIIPFLHYKNKNGLYKASSKHEMLDDDGKVWVKYNLVNYHRRGGFHAKEIEILKESNLNIFKLLYESMDMLNI